MFVLNIVNTLLYHLDHKILIITNNSMKSIPEIKMSAHTHARTLKRTLLSSVKSQSNCPVAYIKGYNPTHSSALYRISEQDISLMQGAALPCYLLHTAPQRYFTSYWTYPLTSPISGSLQDSFLSVKTIAPRSKPGTEVIDKYQLEE